MRETKDIWVKARQHQREIVELRKALEVRMLMQSPCEEVLKFDCCSWR